MIKNKKGQLTLVNMLGFFVNVVVAAVLTVPMSEIVSESVGMSNLSTTASIIMNSMIFFFWLAVLITLFLYVTPQRPEQF